MDDITRNLEIIDEFNSLLKRIEGGTIYGKKIKTYNVPDLVVAAYYLGRSESGNLVRELEEAINEI